MTYQFKPWSNGTPELKAYLRFPLSYTQLESLLNDKKTNSFRILANKCFVERFDGCIAIRLHETDIIRFFEDGKIILSCGDWHTAYTKVILNLFLSGIARVWQDKGAWYICGNDHKKNRFYNGMIIDNKGRLIDENAEIFLEELRKNDEYNKVINKKIKKYLGALTCGEVKKALEPDTMLGDCFVCRMGGTDCLETHMQEYYYVGTMILRAYQEKGYTYYAAYTDVVREENNARIPASMYSILASYMRKALYRGLVTVK